jgi:PPOX class probable F420-dependent enzyme
VLIAPSRSGNEAAIGRNLSLRCAAARPESAGRGYAAAVFWARSHDSEELTMTEKVIPESHLDLFKKKAFANLATLMPNGQPQVTPVWVDFDGRHVVINTAEGRQKDKNLQRDGRVALSIMDPDNPYRYLEVRGHVVDRTRDGADHHIDAMAKKYLGKDKYPFSRPGEVRVIYKVEPERITSTT